MQPMPLCPPPVEPKILHGTASKTDSFCSESFKKSAELTTAYQSNMCKKQERAAEGRRAKHGASIKKPVGFHTNGLGCYDLASA